MAGRGLDEVIILEMQRRGHSTVTAARVMGMSYEALRRFLRGDVVLGFGSRNCELVAGYLGWTVRAVVLANQLIRGRRKGWKRGGEGDRYGGGGSAADVLGGGAAAGDGAAGEREMRGVHASGGVSRGGEGGAAAAL